jgi:hypothetical protein
MDTVNGSASGSTVASGGFARTLGAATGHFAGDRGDVARRRDCCGRTLPPARLIAVIGSVFVSFFTLHVLLAGLVGVMLALLARRLGGHRATTIILWLAILATVGAAVPLFALVRLARHYSAPISWAAHLRAAAPGLRPTPDQTQLFATVDGKKPIPRRLPPSQRSDLFPVWDGDAGRAGGDDSRRRLLARRAQRRNPMGPLVCGARVHRL